MTFEIILDSRPTGAKEPELERVALRFLRLIGYLPPGYDTRTGASDALESIPYRLFVDCFLGNPEKAWSVGELARALGTSIPTVYRHLDKLAALDLLGQGSLEGDLSRKGYFLRYHDLRRAWRFTEVNVELSMASYRRVVDIIQASVGTERKRDEAEPSRNSVSAGAEREFRIRVVNHRFNFSDRWDKLAVELLTAADYLSDIGPMDLKRAKRSIPFRLLVECLLKRPEAGWTIDELSTTLETTKPTVYRYLRRLGQLGVLERSLPGESTPEDAGAALQKRRFRIRRGNLSKAWNVTEWYAKSVMKSYRRTVERIAELAEEGREKRSSSQ
ncbi:MAG: hypothetical protein QXW06_07290 [Thermoplasmata archaeon]